MDKTKRRPKMLRNKSSKARGRQKKTPMMKEFDRMCVRSEKIVETSVKTQPSKLPWSMGLKANCLVVCDLLSCRVRP